MKNNRRFLSALVCILIILLAVVGTMLVYPLIQQDIIQSQQAYEKAGSQEEYEKNILTDYVNQAYVGGFGFYMEIQERLQNKTLDAGEVFFPEYIREEMETNEYFPYQLEDFSSQFEEWNSMYQTSILGAHGVKYQVNDLETGEYLSNAAENLSEKNPDDYAFYMKYSYDEKGNFRIENLKSDLNLTVEELGHLALNKSYVLDTIGYYSESVLSMEIPKGITVYLMSTNAECYFRGMDRYHQSYDYTIWLAASRNGLPQVWLAVMALLIAAAMVLPMWKKLSIGKGVLGKLPLEISAVLISLSIWSYEIMEDAVIELYNHEGNYYMLEHITEDMPYLIHFGMWFAFYAMWFVGFLSLRQVFSLGLLRYIKEKIWCIAFWIWLWKICSGTVRWILQKIRGVFGRVKKVCRRCVITIQDIDLTNPSDKMLIKILGLNFVVVFFLCVWVFGIVGLIIYTLVLFFVLKKYIRTIKDHYGIIIGTTRRLANGDLSAEITEDTGIFEPLKKELNTVQAGFSKAVEEEIKSQNMKSELITNVSHDLKTPLTAIITYINLLKDENISEEDRKNYISILDRKSLRLKQLIEDLFEISKAASGNIKVEKKMLNLTELVKQAALEMEDRLSEARIECRISVPEKEILMELDGEKTYRCMENLLINVSKYGMAGTRAYLSLAEKGDDVLIVVKNISAEELTVDVEELTDRFIRGDKSRNTEGSGLGLAIVKSFVELQGGNFWIETDGDLFKACIRFNKGVI